MTMCEETPEARRPQQERGRRRVELILDAAAELILESGVQSLTMHGIAARSGAAIGSLYHFFPNLSTVLDELGERHAREMRLSLTQLDASDVDWAGLSTEEAVDRFLHPFLDHFESHPDVLMVVRYLRRRGEPPDSEILAAYSKLARTIVSARRPGLGEREGAVRAKATVAVVSGILDASMCGEGRMDEAIVRELRRLLVAYLDAP